MRLSELMEGQVFSTRITNRVGMVRSHSERGVEVEWLDTKRVVFLHPDVIVSVV